MFVHWALDSKSLAREKEQQRHKDNAEAKGMLIARIGGFDEVEDTLNIVATWQTEMKFRYPVGHQECAKRWAANHPQLVERTTTGRPARPSPPRRD